MNEAFRYISSSILPLDSIVYLTSWFWGVLLQFITMYHVFCYSFLLRILPVNFVVRYPACWLIPPCYVYPANSIVYPACQLILLCIPSFPSCTLPLDFFRRVSHRFLRVPCQNPNGILHECQYQAWSRTQQLMRFVLKFRNKQIWSLAHSSLVSIRRSVHVTLVVKGRESGRRKPGNPLHKWQLSYQNLKQVEKWQLRTSREKGKCRSFKCQIGRHIEPSLHKSLEEGDLKARCYRKTVWDI